MGAAATQMERRGIRTERGDINRQIEISNAELRQTKARIKKLQKWLAEEAKAEPPTFFDIISGLLDGGENKTHSQKLIDLKAAAKDKPNVTRVQCRNIKENRDRAVNEKTAVSRNDTAAFAIFHRDAALFYLAIGCVSSPQDASSRLNDILFEIAGALWYTIDGILLYERLALGERAERGVRALYRTNGELVTTNHFMIGDELQHFAVDATRAGSVEYQRRDFVTPLLDFCEDGCYNGRIGIVYGLRSTGKTVGMLQAALELNRRGYRAAYAHFNYEETGMNAVTAEIGALAKKGVTHFFVDEASYLGGFVNLAPDWSDTLTPLHRIKIIISGTDSFMLWTARLTSLFHRYVQFPTNWNSFPEYKRIQGKGFDEYKTRGGIFTAEDMSDYVRSALVDNLIHTVDHCVDEANRTNSYTDTLYGIKSAVIYKAVISILRCAAEAAIKRHFINNAGEKNVAELGSAVSGWLAADKQDIKERIADSLSVYEDFSEIDRPSDVIEALLAFLEKIGCLIESCTAMSDIGRQRPTYYFCHNMLMSYAVEETKRGAASLGDAGTEEFLLGIDQAAEGYFLESIVFSHVFRATGEDEKVFKYRDLKGGEIDIVSINRKAQTLTLIEVKSKSRIDERGVFGNEARHLFDDEILRNISVSDSYTVTRILVYQGESRVASIDGKELLIVNAEEFVSHAGDLSVLLETVRASRSEHDTIKKRDDGFNSVLDAIEEYKKTRGKHTDEPAVAPDRDSKGKKRKNVRER